MSASTKHTSTKRRVTGERKTIKELAALSKVKEKEIEKPDVVETVDDDEPWAPAAYTVFKIVMSARLCAAAWNIVGDCDETYNYWEPTHYLMFGKGFQTWEYSPVYAIRSYAYLMLHTLPMRLYGLFTTPNPVMLFFITRCVLAFVCSLCEVFFYKGVCKQFGNNVLVDVFFKSKAGILFIISDSQVFSALYYFPDFGGFSGLWVAIMATAASTILGWPFAGIIGAPIALDLLLRQRKIKFFVLWSLLALVTFLWPMIQLDMYYYGKLVVAPLNIVMYNVFTDHGPDLYGVEPFSYYILNGLLNFNAVFVWALCSLPFVIVYNVWTKEKERGIPCWLALSAMYIWFLIFFTRPHKEERFLFPVYPLIGLSAALTIDYKQKCFSKFFPGNKLYNYAENTSWISMVAGIFFSLMSISRVIALYQGYHAPLDLFVELNKIASDPKIHNLPEDRPVNVCVGKEWYRYPSSFFLPAQNWNLQFLQSEFKGQLPKPYSNEPHATRQIPTHMNDVNKEEPTRYVNISKCHYFVTLSGLEKD
ncbi:alpha-1,2-mannosyltransferase ALG9-like [Ruditapes philippinarum]|uniref:alpha-1,2-mannosyltransferase ALG9-like n=1 Tax=Ruditapes philippinarum TaxID=129788 RepID=UPI00295AB349|nr:alpha-1,2-mannosyltransferase ALG9-like [Ruditapes philippinarum]